MHKNKIFHPRAFTMVEIMVVTLIIWLLAAAIYVGVWPYIMRSRDTSRLVRTESLANVFDAFKKSADKFPSNFGSWSPIIKGYCISEIVNRPDGGTADTKFTSISKGIQSPPVDPLGSNARPIWPCDMSGSYFYSLLNDGVNDETAIIATRLELQSTANYGTGADLTNSGMAQYLFLNTKKGSVPSSAPDSLYFHSSR